MPLKVLSGVLKIKDGSNNGGTATINFMPHQVNGDATLSIPQLVGNAARPFRAAPSTVFAVRQFKIKGASVGIDTDVNINELSPPDVQKVAVEWKAPGAASIHEISYMVVGETGA